MSKLRIIYIASLIILGVLLIFTVFKPMVPEENFSAVTRESIIQREGEWIIQFDIINREDKDTNYIIVWSIEGEVYRERVLVKDGGTFSYIHHVYQETVKESKVNLTIYKEGEHTPFEQTTFYFK